jgi:hypothetical protein
MITAISRTSTPGKGAQVESEQGPITRVRGAWHRPVAVLTLALALGAPSIAVLTGSSAGATGAAAKKPTKAQIAHTCAQVSDALADGPDPDADPVGHALAQILPLRAIKTTDAPLKKDIATLANAYATFVKENGTKTANKAVNAAGKAVDSICPGAF